jgi:hypothetical protein
MSRTHKDSPAARSNRLPRRSTSVRAVRRDPPDIRKLSRALIALALSEASEADQASQPAEPAATTDDPEQEPDV